MIVECKRPNVEISQDTFYQIAKYNFNLKVQYLVVTNGMKHYCCEVNYDLDKIDFLKEIPDY